MFGNCGGNDLGDLKYALRFTRASSEYMTNALLTPTNQKKFTVSVWVKRVSTGTYQAILSDQYTSNFSSLYFDSSNNLYFDIQDTVTVRSIATNATYTGTSELMHIVATCDTTSATSTITGSATDRMRLYVDGNQITSFTVGSPFPPALDYLPTLNQSGTTHYLGGIATSAPNYYLDAQMARFVFIDGLAMDASSFGRRNASGKWISKTVAEIAAIANGTGANNAMLEFNDNSSATLLGNDYSSKNNDYTPVSLSTSDRTINY